VRFRVTVKSVLCGLLTAVIVGGRLGVVVALAVGMAVHGWLRRRPTPDQLAEVRRLDADLPFAADLVAAALRSGAPPDSAAGCAGRALGGPVGERLQSVARALRLGTPADEAWSYLGEADAARRLARAAVRSQHSGAALAGSFLKVADDLRDDRLIAADAEGRRAGVLIVLPLGLCFLPAFVLAGLVPVIVAVLGGVLNP
jgi:Flp pilus assembly protein TadB